MKGSSNSININSNSGDLIYATNNSSATTISSGDTVFMNYPIAEQEVTSQGYNNNSYFTSLCDSDSIRYIYYIGSSSGQPTYYYILKYDSSSSSWTSNEVNLASDASNILFCTSSGQYYTKKLGTTNNITASTSTILGYIFYVSGAIALYRILYLGDGLCLYYNGSTTNLCSIDETTGEIIETFGALNDTACYYAALQDNVLMVQTGYSSSTTVKFYDITDKSSLVLLNSTSTSSTGRISGNTGTTSGNYVMINSSSTVNIFTTGTETIYKIDDSYNLIPATDLPSPISDRLGTRVRFIYNNYTKVLAFCDRSRNAFAYTFDDTTHKFTALNIPQLDWTNVSGIYSNCSYMFSISKNLKYAAVNYRADYTGGSRGYYKWFKYNSTDKGWEIVDFDEVTEFSLTGRATGNEVDSKYEVTTLLPTTTTVTISTTPDDVTINFIGEAE